MDGDAERVRRAGRFGLDAEGAEAGNLACELIVALAWNEQLDDRRIALDAPARHRAGEPRGQGAERALRRVDIQNGQARDHLRRRRGHRTRRVLLGERGVACGGRCGGRRIRGAGAAERLTARCLRLLRLGAFLGLIPA